jgi:hypothetical protein
MSVVFTLDSSVLNQLQTLVTNSQWQAAYTVCTEKFIPVDDVVESPKLVE